MKTLNPFALTAIGLSILSLVLQVNAGVYKCLDASQKVFYQDKPCMDLTTARLPSHIGRGDGASDNRVFMWKATLPGKGEAYLLGSLHFGVKDMYPLSPRIMDAFNASDVLVVETSLDDQQSKESLKELSGQGQYPENESLEDHVKPGTWTRLLAAAKRLDVAEATVRQLKPWMASLILTQRALDTAGVDADMGIDKAFVKDASTKKPIMQIETAARQLQLLQSLNDDEQEQWLLQTISEADKAGARYGELADAWKKGDADTMDWIVHRSFDNNPISINLYKRFFTDRNVAMADKINELLQDGRKYFFVIGAGHLGGEMGIIKLLEAKGFRIEQP